MSQRADETAAGSATMIGKWSPLPLREFAYQAIRSGIILHRWRTGDLLSEQQLAEELEISRTPVREALQKLAREGFVAVFPSRGTVVAGLSVDDLRQIYELREALECQVVRLVAERATPVDVAALHEVLARAARQLEVPDEPLQTGGDLQRAMARIDELIRSGSELHRTLAQIAGNRRIQEILRNLEYQTIRARLMHGATGRSREFWAEHKAIVDAVARHDAEEAQALMRRHIWAQYEFVVGARLKLD
ncbi:MAG: GntR family transcriptional regulator [Chloroflexi bacterium]|nr:GntR family transcriptional regulator [Chloroflexota bacterium]